MRCVALSRALFSALLLLVACGGLFSQAPASPLPKPNAEAPSVSWSLSKASQELVERLTERRQEVTALQANLRTLTDSLTELESQLTASQSELTALQQDLTATSNLLAESRQNLADIEAAVASERKARDAELAAWKWYTGGAVLVAVGAVVWGVTRGR